MALRGNLLRQGFLKIVGVGLVTTVLGACGVNEKDYNAMKSENEDLRQRVAASEGQLREKDGQLAAMQAAQVATPKQPAWEPNDGGSRSRPTNIKAGRDGAVLEVAGDVLFASGQATLKPDSKKELDKVVRTLNSQWSGHRVRVEGYTDTDKPSKGKYKSNEALSEARADAVRDYLVQKGISSNMITAVGMGSSKSRATKKDSRRVEIVVVGE